MSVDSISDLIEQTLAQAGVRRIYGLVGDSLNGITESVRKQGRIDWIHVRHEETAAFAAGAEAHLTNTLAIAALQSKVIVAQDTQVDIVSGAMFRSASSAYFPTLCLREIGG